MNLDQESYNAHTTPMQSHSNIGSGEDITIKELALTVVYPKSKKDNLTDKETAILREFVKKL